MSHQTGWKMNMATMLHEQFQSSSVDRGAMHYSHTLGIILFRHILQFSALREVAFPEHAGSTDW